MIKHENDPMRDRGTVIHVNGRRERLLDIAEVQERVPVDEICKPSQKTVSSILIGLRGRA